MSACREPVLHVQGLRISGIVELAKCEVPGQWGKKALGETHLVRNPDARAVEAHTLQQLVHLVDEADVVHRRRKLHNDNEKRAAVPKETTTTQGR